MQTLCLSSIYEDLKMYHMEFQAMNAKLLMDPERQIFLDQNMLAAIAELMQVRPSSCWDRQPGSLMKGYTNQPFLGWGRPEMPPSEASYILGETALRAPLERGQHEQVTLRKAASCLLTMWYAPGSGQRCIHFLMLSPWQPLGVCANEETNA